MDIFHKKAQSCGSFNSYFISKNKDHRDYTLETKDSGPYTPALLIPV